MLRLYSVYTMVRRGPGEIKKEEFLQDGAGMEGELEGEAGRPSAKIGELRHGVQLRHARLMVHNSDTGTRCVRRLKEPLDEIFVDCKTQTE